MSKIAVVFPGQGSQFVGMGKDFYDNFSQTKDFFSNVDDKLGYSLTKIMFEGPEEELKTTYNTQPALLSMSIAVWELIKERLNPNYFAGHSLGEYSAVVAAGGLCFDDALLAVHNRGKFMQEAVPFGIGAMAAVIGAEDQLIIDTCNEISKDNFIVEPANFNTNGQLVVAGHAEAVDHFIAVLKTKGVRKAIKLPVSAPFHCSLMKPAEEKMKSYLDNITFCDLSIPVVNNIVAEVENSAVDVKNALVKQVSSPVRWTDSIKKLSDLGVDTFLEVGAGTVLTGLIKKINKDAKCFSISNISELDNLGGFHV